MLERMGVNFEPIPDVVEVIIKTSNKDMIIKNPSVSEIKAKDMSMFQVVGDISEEIVKEIPKFTEEDILLVSQQANVSKEVAEAALTEAEGDLAKAILKLTS
jgi:nascent polypeptide-associated complex subunit alpha